uniref:Chemokine interleukin-8-like domain-containing protein n=1 Tax=Myripristis murdjan TaxID=586833 RepID=A0A667Z4F6_9TELE
MRHWHPHSIAVSFCFCLHARAAIPLLCCIKVLRNISPHVLVRVERWDIQKSTGACDINAVLLHLRGLKKPICASPMVLQKLKRIRRME